MKTVRQITLQSKTDKIDVDVSERLLEGVRDSLGLSSADDVTDENIRDFIVSSLRKYLEVHDPAPEEK